MLKLCLLDRALSYDDTAKQRMAKPLERGLPAKNEDALFLTYLID
ncbi:hypothetical protein [Pseudomonas sp. ICMP 561]|nr:hypothetical protein [Pseudomonas sp. ICMP 561]